ncbi:O-antigen ligase family protein [Acinetobacter johnsonii]|jgi:hypothetical protein|uniref:O-antigen ligase family protein n=1 Tax=Acinetobacter johnsonii TaxID=40214 RepID=UPI0022E57886|nr:O-antigen ligase family protein [Acinetobacter johnsonii]
MAISLRNLEILLISLGFFFSQFYILPSGLPQPAHIFITLSFFMFVFLNTKLKIVEAKPLILFVCYVVFVNIYCTFLIGDLSFIVSTVYWIFNLILFLVLLNLKFEYIEKFFNYLRFIIPLSLMIGLVIWVMGAGRYDFNPRYNGYFNDPNQMAFWVLCSCAVGLILFNKLKYKILIYSLSFFLILLTMSRSASLGLLILTFGLVFQHKGRLDLKIIFSLLSLFFAIAVFLVLLKLGFLESIITRFSEGIESNDQQVSDRGFNNLINYPQYLFFGAGQGAYYRFSPTNHEIHSTWIGILFYYGIIGFVLFLVFLFNIFKKLNFAEKIIFLGPMFYGFFTYNVRTLVFWFLIAVFLLYSKYREQV